MKAEFSLKNKDKMPHFSYFGRLPRESKLEFWRLLCRTALAELKIRYDIKDQNSKRVIHTIALLSLGEEAIPLGVALACDPKRDWIAPSHRSKGACFRFGITPKDDFLVHALAKDSMTMGRDGNIHYGSKEHHILPFISHMAAHWPAAVGIAEAMKYRFENGEITKDEMGFVICFCGDGASRQGIFHETVNLAAVRNLPIGFVIDNNGVATDTPIWEQSAKMRISDMAHGYNIRGEHISNANNIIDVYNHAARLISQGREIATQSDYHERNGLPRAPFVLDCVTFRMAEHNETRQAQCVDPVDFLEWGANDPVRFLFNYLIGYGREEKIRSGPVRQKPKEMYNAAVRDIFAEFDDMLNPQRGEKERYRFDGEFSPLELAKIATEEKEAINKAYEEAAAAAKPVPDDDLLRVYPTEIYIPKEHPVEPFESWISANIPDSFRKQTISYGDALQRALYEVAKNDSRIRVFGEDVGGRMIDGEARGGGVFGMTRKLVADPKLFKKQCFNTPLAEIGIVGLAIGQAWSGLIPIAEIQYLPFASPALEQLIDYIPGRYWANRMPVHAIFRLPCGGGKSSGEYHSSMRLEATFYHTPGLKMLHPSTPKDVIGLMRSAVKDDSPILYFEDLWGYGNVFGVIGEEAIQIGPAAFRKEGADLTIIAWGARTWFEATLPAVVRLEQNGYSIELIDLRTLAPLDEEFLVRSAKKTHRVLIVHEDIVHGGIGESIAATIQRQAFSYLLAPIEIVGEPFCQLPQHPALEEWALPSSERVYNAAQKLLEYA